MFTHAYLFHCFFSDHEFIVMSVPRPWVTWQLLTPFVGKNVTIESA